MSRISLPDTSPFGVLEQTGTATGEVSVLLAVASLIQLYSRRY